MAVCYVRWRAARPSSATSRATSTTTAAARSAPVSPLNMHPFMTYVTQSSAHVKHISRSTSHQPSRFYCACVSDDSVTSLLAPAAVGERRRCRSSSGHVYAHHDAWTVGACQSCVCSHGQIHCFSQTCPILTCQRTTHAKGHCCPVCQGNVTASLLACCDIMLAAFTAFYRHVVTSCSQRVERFVCASWAQRSEHAVSAAFTACCERVVSCSV